MRIEDIIRLRARARWEAEGHGARWECRHERAELRRWTLKNGAVHYVKQCLLCGEKVGSAVPHHLVRGTVADFDAALREDDQAAWDRFYELRRAEFWRWYEQYLEGPEWRALRAKALERDRGICQGCGAHASQVHHLTYANVGAEFLFELIAICRACHERLHAGADANA